MLDKTNVSSFKIKFATFLSKLFYGASLSLEHISYKAAYTDIFSFTEKNNFKLFMEAQYSELAKRMYGSDLIYESDNINPVYWAGLQYINIFINKKIPLRQIFLLCPLNEMVAHYEIYHEMNENALIEEFMDNEYKRSIFSLILKKKRITFNKLSFLTGISINTLKSYTRSNETLFKASFSNLTMIMNYLGINETSLFMKKSLFIDINSIFSDEYLKERFIDKVKEYLDITKEESLVLVDRDYKKHDANGIYIAAVNTVVYNKNRVIVLSDEDVIYLINNCML